MIITEGLWNTEDQDFRSKKEQYSVAEPVNCKK